MKKITRFQFLLFPLIAIFLAHSASAKMSIAVVDVQSIWEKSSAAEEARKQLKSKDESFVAEVKKKDEELKKEDEELSKKRSVLSADAYEAQRKAFKEKQVAISTALERKRENLKKSIAKATDTVQAAIFDIVASLAKEKEFELAIPKSQAVYASSQIDITADVLKILNQKLPKIDIEVKESEQKAPAAAHKK